MGLTVLCGILPHPSWVWGIFHKILRVALNIVMNMNNVMQDFKKIKDKFRGFNRICPNLIKRNWKLSTWNRLSLETLGSRSIMPKNLPEQCFGIQIFHTFGKLLVQKGVHPRWTDADFVLRTNFQTDFQACTENLPNVKSCKTTTNSQPTLQNSDWVKG